MAGIYGPPKRVGRPCGHYRRSARRVDERHARGRAKIRLGPQKVITISTNENTPEWRWFQSCGVNTRATRSRAARDDLRVMIESGLQDTIIHGLKSALSARILELECRDAEIRELKHSLGLHFDHPDPKCEGCQ